MNPGTLEYHYSIFTYFWLGERVETIIDKQNELEERLINVMVQLGQGRMTEAEKEAAKELRESERQLQVHKQTISRLKKMSNKLPLPEEVLLIFHQDLLQHLKCYISHSGDGKEQCCFGKSADAATDRYIGKNQRPGPRNQVPEA